MIFSRVLQIENAAVNRIRSMSHTTISACLIMLAIIIVWVAMRKDHWAYKTALLAWLVLP